MVTLCYEKVVSRGGARTSDPLIKSALKVTPASKGSYDLFAFVKGCSRRRVCLLRSIQSNLRGVSTSAWDTHLRRQSRSSRVPLEQSIFRGGCARYRMRFIREVLKSGPRRAFFRTCVKTHSLL